MTKLKKCPFCGGKAEMSEIDQFNDCEILCTKCFCGTSLGKQDETILRWNSRMDERLRVRRAPAVKPVFKNNGDGFR